MARQKIYNQKDGTLNEQDRLLLANLLVKANYNVRRGKEKDPTKKNSYIHFVEFWTDKDA